MTFTEETLKYFDKSYLIRKLLKFQEDKQTTIKPICDKCGKELKEFGALIFSPPFLVVPTGQSAANKYHICKECYPLILKLIKKKKS